MIQIVGLIVGIYALARCIAEFTAKADGRISVAGRLAYGACFLLDGGLTVMLLSTGSNSPVR
jgi:hypothetical protein